ncbi:MAG: membrane protein insertase YidC [Bacteroidetes bacterium]|nr:membrane protein insertase YidC [Bacteroidota bacterium]
MGMDRNTVIGFVLLGILLFLYLFISTKNSQDFAKQKKLYDDSVAMVKAHQDSLVRSQDTAKAKKQVVAVDTTGFNKAIVGNEELLTVENDVMKIVFTNKGAQPKEIELKKFKSYDSTAVKIINPIADNYISYSINLDKGAAQIKDLYFSPGQLMKNPDGSQSVDFRLPTPDGESIVHHFTIRPDDYMVDWDVQITNPSKLFTENKFNLSWQAEPTRAQQGVAYEKRLANISFYEGNDFDYISRKTEKNFEKPVQWVSISQQFFNICLIAKDNFTSGSLHWAREMSDSSNVIAKMDASLQAKIPSGNPVIMPFQVYYGPNNYSILKRQAPGMANIIDLGRGFYSFVRPINVYIIMPVFDFFKRFIASYGIVIMLLTIVIRLITSPLVYSSYLSGAKMKALRPEIDEMKKRVGDDQQRASMEQMKLFREAGVNPLGGCIPALLQIPIFFALYSFFNSNIELRNQAFLWSKDLSAFDPVFHWNLGLSWFPDHLSMFGLLASATNFLISLYGISMTPPDQNNPAMKYMPYIMPLMFLFFFNSLPSALTWYYTVSNLITLVLQYVIQNYIIDHDKILAQLQANRSKPKSKTKWQERFEQMQDSQKKVQDLKNRNNNR